MSRKDGREYRTTDACTIDSFERTDGTRQDGYVLTAADWIPIAPGWLSFGEFLAKKAAKLKKAKADAEATADTKSLRDALRGEIESSAWARALRRRAKNSQAVRAIKASWKADDAAAARAEKRARAFREKILGDE